MDIEIDLDFMKTVLKIDGNEEDLYLYSLIEISLIYIDSMVGEYYKSYVDAVKLAKLLQQKLIHDMYKNRGMEIESSTKEDRIVVSILDKLSNYTEVV